MILKKLSLVNFKNFSNIEFNFSSKINCFIGLNGVGKTNLLDSIYYLSFTKSYFNHVDSQNIKYDEDFFVIQGEFMKNENDEDIYCAMKRNKTKIFKRNKKEYEKFSEHIGLFPVVMITPNDTSVIYESSEERRKLLDGIIAQFDKNYLENLIKYKRILLQRNTLLKNFYEKRFVDRLSLEVWDMQLVETGNIIFQKRKKFIDNFLPIFKNYYNFIADNKENVELIYDSQLQDNDFNTLITNNIDKDLRLTYTSCGVHKDDMIFKISGHSLRKNGSQGQQKTFLLAIKFAQFDYIKTITKIKPLLLLDDFFDKLDHQRTQKIIEKAAEDSFGQIFITHTNSQDLEIFIEKINKDYNIFNI